MYPPLFCFFRGIEMIKIMLMTLIMVMAMAMEMEMALPEKKLEVKKLHHKINLKQREENGLLVSKKWRFLKQWMGKWILVSKRYS